jgi:hypothetical protein
LWKNAPVPACSSRRPTTGFGASRSLLPLAVVTMKQKDYG